jgi:hypothetical protein
MNIVNKENSLFYSIDRPRISSQSKKFGRAISYLHRFIFFLNPTFKRYQKLIIQGHVLRPHYAYAMLQAAILADNLGLKRISAIEFGCAGGSGLVDLEYHAYDIKKYLGVEFEIYGFDSGEGLPPSSDYRDILHLYKQGDYKMDITKISNTLRSTKLLIGPVSETIEKFFDVHNPAPIGVIFNDFDYYTSTCDSFKVFSKSDDKYLPRIFMYFDDTLDTSSHTGELLAINEYNQQNKNKKIDIQSLRAEELSLHWKKWIYLGKKFYYWHNFQHNRYSENPNKDINCELPL